MNNLTNYHSHCAFCDGRAPLEEFVKEAVAQGFTSYGISSHAPLPYSTRWTMEKDDVPAYLIEALELKNKYADRIELYVGMEIDYLNRESNPSIDFFRNLPLDYRIGSVHLLESVEGEIVDVDVSPDKFAELLPVYFENDVKRTVCAFFEKNMRMMEAGGFDIIGHADKMSYNATCYHPNLPNEDWYKALMRDYFAFIAKRGYMVEINTKAFHRFGIFYPHARLFPLLKELKIPVMVNSDAHYPELINSGRPEALKALKEAGIPTVMELHGGRWQEVEISPYYI